MDFVFNSFLSTQQDSIHSQTLNKNKKHKARKVPKTKTYFQSLFVWKKKKKKLSYGCDKVTANIVEANREGDRSPIGSPQHRRQLQPSRQGHSPPSRRRSTRQHLQRHR